MEKKQKAEIEAARYQMENEILEADKFTWANVSKLINWMNYPRDAEGFLDVKKPMCPANNDYQFHSFDGVKVDTQSGKVEFIMSKNGNSRPLFGWSDIYTLLKGGIQSAVFTLDEIDPSMPYNPFHQMRFAPSELADTSVLATCFHADYLLKFFTTGVEISSHAPFPQRSIEAPNGILSHLPAHLREKILEASNSMKANKSSAHRFWIDAGDTPYQEYKRGDSLVYHFGELKMAIKKHLLVRNPITGELEDSINDSSDVSPEADFARVLTKHFPELVHYYPELGRLRELTKVMIAVRIITNFRDSVAQSVAEAQHSLHATTNSIQGKLDETRTDPNQSLNFLPTNVSFPLQSDRGLINTMINHIIDSSDIPYSQRSAARAQAEPMAIKQLKSLNDSILTECQSLSSSTNVPVSQLQSLLWAFKIHGNSYPLARAIAEQQYHSLNNVQNAINCLGIPNGERNFSLVSKPTNSYGCNYVPACFVATESYHIVGGVSLNSNLRASVVNLPPNASPAVINNAHQYQRANSVPNSAAQKMDNLHAFNMQKQQNIRNYNIKQLQYTNIPFFGGNVAEGQKTFSSFQKITLTEPRVVYRAHDGGIKARADGGYFSEERYFYKSQARKNLAVFPEWNGMNKLYKTVIPTGTVVYVGNACAQKTSQPYKSLPGGGAQYYIPNIKARKEMAKSGQPVNTPWLNEHLFWNKK